MLGLGGRRGGGRGGGRRVLGRGRDHEISAFDDDVLAGVGLEGRVRAAALLPVLELGVARLNRLHRRAVLHGDDGEGVATLHAVEGLPRRERQGVHDRGRGHDHLVVALEPRRVGDEDEDHDEEAGARADGGEPGEHQVLAGLLGQPVPPHVAEPLRHTLAQVGDGGEGADEGADVVRTGVGVGHDLSSPEHGGGNAQDCAAE